MSLNESVYDRIKNALGADGWLPEDFVLRQVPDGGMKFADGAMDGTIRFHMGPTKSPDISGLTVVLDLASKERFDDAVNALLTHVMNGGVMLPVIDALQDWVFDHPEDLKPDVIGGFCRGLLVQAAEPEAVKFALTILEMLDQEPEKETQEIVRTLAKSEELTLFCLFFMSSWDNAMDEFFELAKNLKGWGRIHAVSMLKPETQAMADWLLFEGWKNEVMNEYSAMIVIKRAKLMARLEAESIDKKLFETATQLISASLADTPLPGMSHYKNAEPLLMAYVHHAKAMATTLEEYGTIFDIRDFADGQEGFASGEQIGDICTELLDSEACRQVILNSMQKGDGFHLAKAMGMEYAEAAMDTLRDDWKNSYDLIDLLLPEKLFVDEIVELFENKLPLDEMASGPEDELGTDGSFSDYGILSYVVQGMQQVPGRGEKLIAAALLSPVVGCRNIALTTIDKWRKADFPISEGLQQALARLKDEEVNEKTKKRLEAFG